MSVSMPETPSEMLRLPGVTKANLDKYGARLLEITVRSSAEKFTLLAEQDDIEDFSQEAGPSSAIINNNSRGKTTTRAPPRKITVPSSRFDGEGDDGWVNVGSNSQDSPYFGNSRSRTTKKTVTTKKRSFNYGAKKKSVTKRAKSNSPKKFFSKKSASGSSSSNASRGPAKCSNRSANMIGFMPMPPPR